MNIGFRCLNVWFRNYWNVDANLDNPIEYPIISPLKFFGRGPLAFANLFDCADNSEKFAYLDIFFQVFIWSVCLIRKLYHNVSSVGNQIKKFNQTPARWRHGVIPNAQAIRGMLGKHGLYTHSWQRTGRKTLNPCVTRHWKSFLYYDEFSWLQVCKNQFRQLSILLSV